MFNLRVDLVRWMILVGAGYEAWFRVPYRPGRVMIKAPYFGDDCHPNG